VDITEKYNYLEGTLSPENIWFQYMWF